MDDNVTHRVLLQTTQNVNADTHPRVSAFTTAVSFRIGWLGRLKTDTASLQNERCACCLDVQCATDSTDSTARCMRINALSQQMQSTTAHDLLGQNLRIQILPIPPGSSNLFCHLSSRNSSSSGGEQLQQHGETNAEHTSNMTHKGQCPMPQLERKWTDTGGSSMHMQPALISYN